MPRKSRSNALALAVLVCLVEKDMHPYEITQTLRMRATDQAVRLNFGSLYGVVARLEKRGLIVAVETIREGKRPERTIYSLTDSGRTEMTDWLSDLVAVPAKEYLQFEAALALIGALDPDEVVTLLRNRCQALEMLVQTAEQGVQQTKEWGIPRLFVLEGEYVSRMYLAEITWVRGLIADIESGELEGLDGWRQWTETGVNPWADMNGSVAAAAAADSDPDVDDVD